MDTDNFPGVSGEPTARERLGLELADRQLGLIFDLRDMRIKHGLSITDVAEAMGVDPAHVSRFESGSTNPTMATIRRYAKAARALIKHVVDDADTMFAISSTGINSGAGASRHAIQATGRIASGETISHLKLIQWEESNNRGSAGSAELVLS